MTTDPRVLADVVVLLVEFGAADTTIFERRVRAISVDKVLAWAWRPDRLLRCAERLADGERAPEIHVNRYLLHGVAYYTVSDGHHRTIAARQAGQRRIRARIGSESVCHPERYWLDARQRRLWLNEGQRSRLAASDLSEAVMAALSDAGVQYGR